jgi:hypothetical protein
MLPPHEAGLWDALKRGSNADARLAASQLADILEERGNVQDGPQARCLRWMAHNGWRVGVRGEPLVRKRFAWWPALAADLKGHPHELAIFACPHALLPMPVFVALPHTHPSAASAIHKTWDDAFGALVEAVAVLESLRPP